MNLLPFRPRVLQFLIIFIEAVNIEMEEELSLIFLLGRPFRQCDQEHGKGNFDECFSLRRFFIFIMVVVHDVAVVIGHVGETHVVVVGVHEHVGLVVVHKALVEVLAPVHLLLLGVHQAGINGYLVHLVALSVVIGLDEFGGLDLLAVLGVFEVVIVFVLHVEVQGRVAEVLFGAEALIPWKVLVEFGLRAPSLLVVLLFLA